MWTLVATLLPRKRIPRKRKTGSIRIWLDYSNFEIRIITKNTRISNSNRTRAVLIANSYLNWCSRRCGEGTSVMYRALTLPGSTRAPGIFCRTLVRTYKNVSVSVYCVSSTKKDRYRNRTQNSGKTDDRPSCPYIKKTVLRIG